MREPSYTRIDGLADPQFQGHWWILGLALTSLLFNYLLGEELPFRGVLLPRMVGVFGRWDWVANAVLFGLYHVHKIWFWPSMIASSSGTAWAARRCRSLLMCVIVHGVEGFVIVLVLAVLLGWLPLRHLRPRPSSPGGRTASRCRTSEGIIPNPRRSHTDTGRWSMALSLSGAHREKVESGMV